MKTAPFSRKSGVRGEERTARGRPGSRRGIATRDTAVKDAAVGDVTTWNRGVVAVGVLVYALIAVVVEAVTDLTCAWMNTFDRVIAVSITGRDAIAIEVVWIECRVAVIAVGRGSAGTAAVTVLVDGFLGRRVAVVVETIAELWCPREDVIVAVVAVVVGRRIAIGSAGWSLSCGRRWCRRPPLWLQAWC